MSEINIAGIMRSGMFSPNHIGNDAAIFNAVADQLRRRGCKVTVFNEEQFLRQPEVEQPIIVNMCRDEESIAKLQMLEKGGKLVINSGFGIENCMRECMTRLLQAEKIPYPESIIAATNEKVRAELKERDFHACWVKRGDSHSQHREDVTFCRHAEEAQEMLKEFFYRGIKKAVINRHLEGDLVKFYGLRGDPFFYWFYPMSSNPSHREVFSDKNPGSGHRFDLQRLKDIAQRCAEATEVEIFGGDCIVSPQGDITIIDFNDWPSFAPCRNTAAVHIAKHILKIIKLRHG